jgi:hypothetical protein
MLSALDDPNPYTPPATEIGATSLPPGGMPFAGFLVLYFFASFSFMWIFWGLFWSAWMALFTGSDFLTTLIFRGLPGGFIVGFVTSALITAYFGLYMRRKTDAIAFTGDRAEFIEELKCEVAKRRYRLTQQSDRAFTFASWGLVHYRYFDLVVNVGNAQATITGPGAIINIVSSKLRRERKQS